MSYSRHICCLAEKYRQFFEDKTKGQILVLICPYTFHIDYSPLNLRTHRFDAWDYDKELREYVENSVKRLRYFMEHTRDLDNDYVPSMGINFGYGPHSAYYSGQEVVMGQETSWTRPFLTSWDKLDDLKLDKNIYWYRKILEGYRYISEFNAGDFAVSCFSNAGPADMANAIRGDDLFYDIYDEPEMVHRLMAKCVDAIVNLEDDIYAGIEPVTAGSEKGQVTANVWFSGRAPYLSEDFNDLCSLEQFREFGFKYTQNILDKFGGAFVHHHAKGRHIHSELAKLRNLKLLEISWDPNCPRPIDDALPSIIEEHGDLPLMIRCRAEDVYNRIGELKKGRIILMLNLNTLQEGREVMQFIRKHSKI
jgi:hypothetical protein